MPDQLPYRHALAGLVLTGLEMPGKNHLELVERESVSSILAYAGQEASVGKALLAESTEGTRYVGPGEWLFVGELARPIDPGLALVTDQTHGRSRFRLTGPDAARILRKGAGVDFDGGGFPVGSSGNMAFGHLTINLARLAAGRFEILVMRSFAESLFHDIKVAGREYALTFAIAEIAG
jgi:sarcosine oxidase subunit gamma